MVADLRGQGKRGQVSAAFAWQHDRVRTCSGVVFSEEGEGSEPREQVGTLRESDVIQSPTADPLKSETGDYKSASKFCRRRNHRSERVSELEVLVECELAPTVPTPPAAVDARSFTPGCS